MSYLCEDELRAMEAAMQGEEVRSWHDPLHAAYLKDVPQLIATIRYFRQALLDILDEEQDTARRMARIALEAINNT